MLSLPFLHFARISKNVTTVAVAKQASRSLRKSALSATIRYYGLQIKFLYFSGQILKVSQHKIKENIKAKEQKKETKNREFD